MFKTDPGVERSNLGFVEAVLGAFSFLITEYGFRCVKSEATFVRYESARVFVNVYHGRASYELGVEIGQQVNAPRQEERPFSLGEIIEMMDAQEETGYTFLQTSTAEGVKNLVPRLAEYVRKYAGTALRGDPLTFKRLEEVRSMRAERYMKEMRLSRVKPEADRAWRNKDYAKLVKLYESIRDDLTPAEAKKLEYAKKHT